MTLQSSILYAIRILFPKSSPSSSSGRKSNGERSLAGALLCIGLSLVPLVSVLVISDGMIQGITGRLIGLYSQDIAVFLDMSSWQEKYGEKITEKDCMDIAERLSLVEGVTDAFPELDSTALAAGKSARSGASVRAVQGDIFSANKAFASLFTVVEGSVDMKADSSGKNKAVLCRKIADDLGLHAGDSLRLICVNKTAGGSLSPRMVPFTVAGIVSSGYQELDALWVFVPLETVYQFVSLANASFTIMIETPDAYSPDLVRIQRDLKAHFGKYANFYRWDQVHEAEFENFSSTKVMLVFIMILIVLVASINISSAIVMLVMERRREIAILKSIGATPSGITFAFIMTGITCGLGGLAIGLPFGLLAAVNANEIVRFVEKAVNVVAKFGYLIKGVPVNEIKAIKLMDPAYYLQTIPVNLPLSQVLLICLSTVLLALVVSIVPSVKAGKEKPLEILRKA